MMEREKFYNFLITYIVRGGNINSTLPSGTQPNAWPISRVAPELLLGNAPRPSDSADWLATRLMCNKGSKGLNANAPQFTRGRE
jgi:hypothetical protein